MMVDFMSMAIANAAKGCPMTISSVIDIGELREYRKTTKLNNTLQQSRNGCNTYLQKLMWPKNKPLLAKVDYPAWVQKPSFYEEP